MKNKNNSEGFITLPSEGKGEAIKRIEAKIPETGTFFLAFPSPTKDLIDIAENPVEMILVDDGKEIKVQRGDFFRYQLNQMSNLICEITYGHNSDWVARYLKQKYPYLKEDSKIAFFLFKKIANQE